MRCIVALALVVAAACSGATPPASLPSPPTEATAAPAPPASLSSPTPEATTAPTLRPSSWRSAVAPARAPEGGQWIAIGSFDGKPIIAAVYRPASAGPAPVAVVLHGDGGLRERFLGLAQWLTQEGFVTVTPCWSGSAASVPGTSPILGCATDAPQRNSATAVVKDVSAIAEAARTLPGVRADRLALVGHSLGAMAAVLNASMGGTVEAVVAISAVYGQRPFGQLAGTTLPEQVDGLRWPVLMVHGTEDAQAPFIDAKAYEAAARQRGKSVETLYVEGAPHPLPFTPQYWTEDVRGKVIAFLKRQLPG